MKRLPRFRSALAALFFLPLLPFSGCATLQQLSQMANLSQCQFRLASVEQTSLAGIPLQGVNGPANLGPLDLLKLQSAFASGTLPLQCTLNLEARNPNGSPAGMSRMEWVLFMDGNRLTSGVLEKQVEIAPNGGTGAFPLGVSLDLLQVLSGKTLDSMVNLASNIAGEGTRPTRITLQVKPSITVGGQTVDYPGYVTVSHDFGSN